jgi:metal-dependent amidase/aminoacylase/carboxypeptidase family protein
VTGVRADLDSGRPGPALAVLGELDGLIAFGHPHADPETGAAHMCGHNAQIATMLGVGMALVDTGAMEALAGRVVLFAVPAEEYVDLEYRARLHDEGRIEFFGGKPELVRLGHFDDVDMAMMVHASANTPERRVRVGATTNGFVAKTIRFRGKASHAGSRPDLGINALNCPWCTCSTGTRRARAAPWKRTPRA